jgi:hypothetical protein
MKNNNKGIFTLLFLPGDNHSPMASTCGYATQLSRQFLFHTRQLHPIIEHAGMMERWNDGKIITNTTME